MRLSSLIDRRFTRDVASPEKKNCPSLSDEIKSLVFKIVIKKGKILKIKP